MHSPTIRESRHHETHIHIKRLKNEGKHKEDDVITLKQVAAVALIAGGALTACNASEMLPLDGHETTGSEHPVNKDKPVAPTVKHDFTGKEAQAINSNYRDGANVNHAKNGMLFHCVTKNNKEIFLSDRGEFIDYSYGFRGRAPELSLSVPREKVTTFQWKGFGRWITYSITIPNGETKYTVFTSLDRVSDAHDSEAGVFATVGDNEVARILCKDMITSNMMDVDLKQED